MRKEIKQNNQYKPPVDTELPKKKISTEIVSNVREMGSLNNNLIVESSRRSLFRNNSDPYNTS